MLKRKMGEIKSNTVFKTFFDKSENPATISSLDARYLYVNESYLKLRRMKEKQLIGQRWWDTFENKESRKFAKEYFKIIRKNKNYKYRVEYNGENGESVAIDWSAQTLKVWPDKKELIFEMGKDATTEVHLKTQLTHQQKIESLGILAGGIAHEFNNILTSIIGYTSFLKSYLKANSKEKTYISKIQKAALGAAGLTSKLLGFARKGKSIEKLVNVNLIVKEICDIIKSTFAKNIKIKSKLKEQMYHVLADYDQIYQSLMNLLLNSRDVMKEGGEITVKTDVLDIDKDQQHGDFCVPQGKYVSIAVTDTGPGMDKTIKEKIFEPFFTTKKEGEGTGLGLSMVYRTVKSHRGFIFVESRLGKGTTFKIMLPAVSKIHDISDSDDSGIYPIINQDQKKTILIVDDEEEIVDYLETVLNEYGYRVLKARDGKEALNIYKKGDQRIDLFLLDIFMPIMDGLAVIAKVKAINPKLKIIVVTSCSKDDMLSKIRSYGVNYFLFKPFKVSSLMEIISKVMSEKEPFAI